MLFNGTVVFCNLDILQQCGLRVFSAPSSLFATEKAAYHAQCVNIVYDFGMFLIIYKKFQTISSYFFPRL